MSDLSIRPQAGMVPVDDTALAVTDSGGAGPAVVYLNGSYASQRSWRRVIRELGPGYRHITFDERARGRSRRSADYSFDTCVRDVGVVLDAAGVDRAVVVGWSYGAAVAARWASQHPDRAAGAVFVDGAVPWGLTGEANRERIVRAFRQMRFALPLVRPFGLAASMSWKAHAQVNIEINEVSAALEPTLDALGCPGRYVLASGANLGGGAEEMEQMRASLAPVLARKPDLRVFAKVTSNHTGILRHDPAVVAGAIRDVVGTPDPS